MSLGPFRKINYAVAAPAVSPRYAHIENGASELLVEADSDVIVFSNAEAQALTISCVGRMGRGTKQLAANASAANVCSDKKISDLHPALGSNADGAGAYRSPWCAASSVARAANAAKSRRVMGGMTVGASAADIIVSLGPMASQCHEQGNSSAVPTLW